MIRWCSLPSAAIGLQALEHVVEATHRKFSGTNCPGSGSVHHNCSSSNGSNLCDVIFLSLCASPNSSLKERWKRYYVSPQPDAEAISVEMAGIPRLALNGGPHDFSTARVNPLHRGRALGREQLTQVSMLSLRASRFLPGKVLVPPLPPKVALCNSRMPRSHVLRVSPGAV